MPMTVTEGVMTMSDLISRADAIEAVRKELVCDGRHEKHDKVCRFIADVILSALPSADAVQGEWIEVEDYNGDVHYKCDQCGEEWTFPFGTPKENNANFCPNCGAIMERGDEADEG